MISANDFANNFCETFGHSRPSRQSNRRGIIEGINDGLKKEYWPDKADGINEDAMFAEGYRRGNQRAIDYLIVKGQITPEELDLFYHGGVCETQYRKWLENKDVELELMEMGWASQGW